VTDLKTAVVVNPASASGATGRSWTTLRPGLEAALGRFEEAFTTGPGEADGLVRRAVEAGAEQIVVVGGDGTLGEAVGGLFEACPEHGIGARLLREDVVLVPVRRGTGGDFARLFDLPGRGRHLFAHLRSPRVVPLDLGLARFVDASGAARRRAFINVASFGLTGVVDAKLNASGKRWGSASFVGAIGASLIEYRRRPVRIRVDGEVLHEGPLLLGAVANGRYFGGGVKIAPEAELDDGGLDVVLLLRAGPSEVCRVLDVYSGRHVRWSSARGARGRVIEAEPLDDVPCLLDLDGEQPGHLGARFEVVPSAARLRIP
jgi:diacylglycerol kinase family enzyme